MTTDWLLRVGDGKNLITSSSYNIWGIQSITSDGKYFINNVNPGDRLWFVKKKSQGKIVAVAIYSSHFKRCEQGPLVKFITCKNMTDEEVEWTNKGGDWTSDTGVHYTGFYDISHLNLLTRLKEPITIRKHKYSDTSKIHFKVTHDYIVNNL